LPNRDVVHAAITLGHELFEVPITGGEPKITADTLTATVSDDLNHLATHRSPSLGSRATFHEYTEHVFV
jgi:hypothetical protein